MLPAMHYRLYYRQLIIEEISVLTITIEPLRADGEQEAALVLVPPVSGGMQTGRSASHLHHDAARSDEQSSSN